MKSGDAREAFLETFWRKRDPLLIAGGQFRRAEHYRRVWFARTYFSDKVYPWDLRGEVYIRYGEPDYRSRSGHPNRPPPLAVENVKRRIAHQIYDRGYDPEVWIPDSLETWTWTEVRADDLEYWRKPQDIENETFVEPVFPVDRDGAGDTRIPWESWVYVNLGGGTEFVFTDQVMNGDWTFSLPPVGILNLSLVVNMQEFNSGRVLQTVASETPEKFDLPPGMEPLPFYYDIARFRGEGDATSVDIYFGVPLEQVAVKNTQGYVERSLVLSNRDGDIVYRSEAPMRFSVGDTSRLQKGAFVPDVAMLDVSPGLYKLAVKVSDQHSDKWGLYVQELEVSAFGDTLSMSDLEMAWRIGEAPADEKFRKGDVWVLPMPSRHYLSNQSVFVYYEVYNFTRDDFGQTHYRVHYTIQQDLRKGTGVFGALGAGFKHLIASGKPQVAVSYEQKGRDLWAPIYLELDMKAVKPGLNQVAVTVTDLVSGRSVFKRAMFQLSEVP